MDSSTNRKGKQPRGSKRTLETHLPTPFSGPVTKPARGATMRRKAVSLFLCHLLLFACGGVEAGKRRQAKEERSEDGGSGVWGALTYMAVGGGGSRGRKAPEGGGPCCGRSLTASPSSRAPGRGAARSGLHEHGHRRQLCGRLVDELLRGGERGRCARRGLVAVLQSLGASGGSALMGKIGAFLGYTVHKLLENSREKEEEVEEEE
uniref:Uncharacterized protein n=1 Tax=Lynx canadensis TaxID=61383 RepID=A0A667H9K6_LYNCA